MGIEIDKYNGRNTPQELVDIYRINSEIKKSVQKTNSAQKSQPKEEENPEAHLDTYKKHAVSNSIEKQIKEQEAKIKELNENLEGLKETYNSAWDDKRSAILEKNAKARELYKKEISESSIKRMFSNWRKKYLANKDDAATEKEYNMSNLSYADAIEASRLAGLDYDTADDEAVKAMKAYSSADIDYTVGLWNKRDAYWDLAKMYQNLGFAKMREDRFN